MGEKIIFGAFDSEQLEYILTHRSAPLPQEKLIVENIPFSDGVEDYSQILGKFFQERELTYTLARTNLNYEQRKQLEIQTKQLASPYNYMQLHDSHDRGYYWKAKLASMSFVDDAQSNTLTCQLAFKAKPYMYRSDDGFDDTWDEFCFPTDISQFYFYEISKYKMISIAVPNGFRIEPTFTLLEGNVSVNFQDYYLQLKKGKNKNPFIAFSEKDNTITFTGDGIISISYDLGVIG